MAERTLTPYLRPVSEIVRRDDAPPHLTRLVSALADRYRIGRELGAGGMTGRC